MDKLPISDVDAVTVSSKFQVVIPKAVRERQSIHAGQRLFVLDQGIGITFIPDIDIRKLRGAIPGLSLDGIREEEDRDLENC